MATFEQGTATNIADLFSKLSTFATTNGWTQDHSASDRLFLTRNTGGDTVSVAFRWDATTPTCAGVYQHTAFINSGTAPGNHTNDSGQGAVSGTDATLLTGRRVTLTNGSMPYWFFTDSATGTYIYVVVETTAATVWRHFGFGQLQKYGTWTGGAFAYAGRATTGAGSGSRPIATDQCELLDGRAAAANSGTATIQPYVASIHAEGLPGEGGASKWGLMLSVAPTTNDRGGNARVEFVGGFRGGMVASLYGRYSGTVLQGLQPFTPMVIFYRHPSLARIYPMGLMPDVRQCNIANYVGGDQVTIGSDTWYLFPSRSKANAANGDTANQGIAYKKTP